MYAIVEIAGQQFKVERGKKVYVHRLDANEGAAVEFNNVLLIDNDGKVQIGTPNVDGAKVAATVVAHKQGDKVIVFKKKRRKGYQKSNGHRQQFSQILIQGILGKGETLKETIAIEKKAKPVKEVIEKVEAEVAAETAACRDATEFYVSLSTQPQVRRPPQPKQNCFDPVRSSSGTFIITAVTRGGRRRRRRAGRRGAPRRRAARGGQWLRHRLLPAADPLRARRSWHGDETF